MRPSGGHQGEQRGRQQQEKQRTVSGRRDHGASGFPGRRRDIMIKMIMTVSSTAVSVRRAGGWRTVAGTAGATVTPEPGRRGASVVIRARSRCCHGDRCGPGGHGRTGSCGQPADCEPVRAQPPSGSPVPAVDDPPVDNPPVDNPLGGGTRVGVGLGHGSNGRAESTRPSPPTLPVRLEGSLGPLPSAAVGASRASGVPVAGRGR